LNYYVYYRIDPNRVRAARQAVHSLFSAVEKAFGVRGRWMRRRDDPSTYMEVYEDVRDEAAFEALIQREGAKLGVPRVVEAFRNETAEKPA
jgi:quinol monooxygenase YgiN